ncbi:hypothetical protein AS593_04215 [Caulobacter vibrioides]|nr:hypothetical protein AS593_04215 [Caulobacter vibrioides]
MSALLGFLRGPIAGLVGSVVSALLLIAVVVLGFKLIGAEHRAGKAQKALAAVSADRDRFRTDLATCSTNRLKLDATIAAQNISIKKYKVAAEAQVEAAQIAVQKALEKAARSEERLRKLLADPPKSVNRCDAANAAIDLAITQ